MVKLRGPLFSETAHGSIGPRLTYSARKIVRQVRYQKKQKDRTTLKRTTQRGYFQMAISWWGVLSIDEERNFAGYGIKEN